MPSICRFSAAVWYAPWLNLNEVSIHLSSTFPRARRLVCVNMDLRNVIENRKMSTSKTENPVHNAGPSEDHRTPTLEEKFAALEKKFTILERKYESLEKSPTSAVNASKEGKESSVAPVRS